MVGNPASCPLHRPPGSLPLPGRLAALIAGLLLAWPWNHSAARAQDDSFRPEVVIGLLELLVESDPAAAQTTLRTLRARIQSRELSESRLAQLRPRLETLLAPARQADLSHPLHADALLLAASWGDSTVLPALAALARDEALDGALRAEALRLWLDSETYRDALALARRLLHHSEATLAWKQQVLQALGHVRHEEAARLLIDAYPIIEPTLQPQVIEILTRRTTWSKLLLLEIERERIPLSSLHANQVARLQASPDEELVALSRRVWGTVRAERNPERQRVIQEVREKLAASPGNPFQGREVFRKVCANCHRLHGEGHDVGPDITRNGRSQLAQLLSNVLDPSLVIGAAYQGRIVVTADGQVLTGLVSEENTQRVVLKLPGGEREVIPTDEIELMRVSELSLMPEGLEEQLTDQELVDLFAYLQLDKPPEDPTAQRIPLE